MSYGTHMNNAASPTHTDLTDAIPAARDSDFTVALDDAMMSLLNNDDVYSQYDGDPSAILFALLVAGVARYGAMP